MNGNQIIDFLADAYVYQTGPEGVLKLQKKLVIFMKVNLTRWKK